MGDSSTSYIDMVLHLIEKCLLFHMTKEECVEALSKHANIKPVITSTGRAQRSFDFNLIWKINPSFDFDAYSGITESGSTSCICVRVKGDASLACYLAQAMSRPKPEVESFSSSIFGVHLLRMSGRPPKL
ncbi:uncharacterized protein LOC143851785 isoform X1 [Tasmannia lanceolata]|uniref:uncharacterized protein LOC143851785 isoform X1 n=1 Tax=Tasmannia lanceolata TaxID=3420 RepID=UPI004062C10F